MTSGRIEFNELKIATKCLVILTFLFGKQFSFAQSNTTWLDSLNNIIIKTAQDTSELNQQVEALTLKVFNEYYETDEVYENLIENTKRLNNKKLQAAIEYIQLFAWVGKGNIDKVIKYSDLYINNVKNVNPKEEWKYHNLLGNFYADNRLTDKTVEEYLIAIQQLNQFNRDSLLSIPEGNLGVFYLSIDDFDNSLKYINQAKQRSLKIKDTDTRNYNLFYDYMVLGNIHYEKKDYLTTRKYYKKCLEAAEKKNDPLYIISAYLVQLKVDIAEKNFENTESDIDYLYSLIDSFDISQNSNSFAFLNLYKAQYLSSVGRDIHITTDSLKNIYHTSEYQNEIEDFEIQHFQRIGEHQKTNSALLELMNKYKRKSQGLSEDLSALIVAKYEKERLNRENTILREAADKRKNIVIFFLAGLMLATAFGFTQFRHKQKILKLNSELKSSNNSINSYNEELKRLSYITTHDLKEPANTINAYCKLILSKYGDQIPTAGQELFKTLHRTSDDMLSLISKLYSYLMVERSTAKKRISLNLIIKKAIKNLSNLITTDTEIIINQLPEIVCNEISMVQAFENLIDNSIAFQSDERNLEIEISAQDMNSHYEITYSDNGIGIKEESISKIFDLFYSQRKTSPYTGQGIGLTIAKKIIESHGGSISVNSKRDNGTSFVISFDKSIPVSK